MKSYNEIGERVGTIGLDWWLGGWRGGWRGLGRELGKLIFLA